MKNIKAIKYKGRSEKVGPSLKIVRSLPNPKFHSIGSIVFVDHLLRQEQMPKTPEMPDGGFAHPHRGIATFTYILEGGVHHLDSNGGEGKVYEGGIQWMKAGNGVIHDEFQPYDLQKNGSFIHGFQFWLNLPSANKNEAPSYLAIQGADVPEINLSNNAGKLRVLLGEYEDKKSTIPSYLDQFMGHLKINGGATVPIASNPEWEYGFYIINGKLKIDDTIELSTGEIAQIHNFADDLKLTNLGSEDIDVIILGGEEYTEDMVAYGPFVMNTKEEIQQAYNDFKSGKYGKIDYSKVNI